MTPAEVAATLGITQRTVRRLAADGELRRVTLGHRTARYVADDVQALIERSTSEAQAGNPGLAKSAVMGDGHATG
jgi:excisionase family DNA binding protein